MGSSPFSSKKGLRGRGQSPSGVWGSAPIGCGTKSHSGEARQKAAKYKNPEAQAYDYKKTLGNGYISPPPVPKQRAKRTLFGTVRTVRCDEQGEAEVCVYLRDTKSYTRTLSSKSNGLPARRSEGGTPKGDRNPLTPPHRDFPLMVFPPRAPPSPLPFCPRGSITLWYA